MIFALLPRCKLGRGRGMGLLWLMASKIASSKVDMHESWWQGITCGKTYWRIPRKRFRWMCRSPYRRHLIYLCLLATSLTGRDPNPDKGLTLTFKTRLSSATMSIGSQQNLSHPYIPLTPPQPTQVTWDHQLGLIINWASQRKMGLQLTHSVVA